MRNETLPHWVSSSQCFGESYCLIFKEKCLTLKKKVFQSFEMLEITDPITKHDIPEDFNICRIAM
jgi:hypothetical protein